MSALPTDIPRRPLGVVQANDVEMDACRAKHLVLIDAMIAWQIANPGKPWTHAAPALGCSALWLRMMASSDAFKARYNDVKDDIIREVGMLGLKEKIQAAAEMAVEKLAEKLQTAESMGDVIDATELLLNTHYGPGGQKAPAPTQVSIQANLILEARQQIIAGPQQQPAPLTIDQPKE